MSRCTLFTVHHCFVCSLYSASSGMWALSGLWSLIGQTKVVIKFRVVMDFSDPGWISRARPGGRTCMITAIQQTSPTRLSATHPADAVCELHGAALSVLPGCGHY
jgi:hypothetical protein